MVEFQQYLADELRAVLGDCEVGEGLPACDLAAAIAVRVLSGSLYTRDEIARIESTVRRDEVRRTLRAIRALDVPASIRGTASEALYLEALKAAVTVVGQR